MSSPTHRMSFAKIRFVIFLETSLIRAFSSVSFALSCRALMPGGLCPPPPNISTQLAYRMQYSRSDLSGRSYRAQTPSAGLPSLTLKNCSRAPVSLLIAFIRFIMSSNSGLKSDRLSLIKVSNNVSSAPSGNTL